MSKRDAKNIIRPHTEAKLQFYVEYLKAYLPILRYAPGINRINIYDLFCGPGVYEDGKEGSSLRAIKSIREAQRGSNSETKITLFLNDSDKSKVDKLRPVADAYRSPNLRISFTHQDAEDVMREISGEFEDQNKETRNLLFVDPYGYKSVRPELLKKCLSNEKTEIILFLPVFHMYRFQREAMSELDVEKYQALRGFMSELNLNASKGFENFVSNMKSALSFSGRFYSAAYAIKGDNSSHHALFFMTSHIRGLEKILETQWKLDPTTGSRYTGGDQRQKSLPLITVEPIELKKHIVSLLKKKPRSNAELYVATLKHGFLPKHANAILKRLRSTSKLRVYNLHTQKTVHKGAFHLSYDKYRESNAGQSPSLRFEYQP